MGGIWRNNKINLNYLFLLQSNNEWLHLSATIWTTFYAITQILFVFFPWTFFQRQNNKNEHLKMLSFNSVENVCSGKCPSILAIVKWLFDRVLITEQLHACKLLWYRTHSQNIFFFMLYSVVELRIQCKMWINSIAWFNEHKNKVL